MADRKKLVAASPQPCVHCPWRLANQGRQPDPHGFYTAASLHRLWNGLRTGNAPGMTCHPTDPQMDAFDGYEATAARERTHECAGALILELRELAVFEWFTRQVEAEVRAGVKLRGGEAYRRYRRARKGGLNRAALAELVWRLAVRMPGSIAIPALPLADPEVGHAPVPFDALVVSALETVARRPA